VRCRKWVSSCELEGAQVRIPAQARAAGGSDAHRTVIDQAAGREYDTWETEPHPPSGGALYIGHGGMTRIGTADADGLGSNAAHFGLAAGVIRPEELAAGEIDHALFMVVKCTKRHLRLARQGPRRRAHLREQGTLQRRRPGDGPALLPRHERGRDRRHETIGRPRIG
jgi:hypothetical protein